MATDLIQIPAQACGEVADFVQQRVDNQNVMFIALLDESTPHLQIGCCERFMAFALEKVDVSLLKSQVSLYVRKLLFESLFNLRCIPGHTVKSFNPSASIHFVTMKKVSPCAIFFSPLAFASMSFLSASIE